MSRNISTIIKWVPLQSEEHIALFLECIQLKNCTEKLLNIIENFLAQFQLKNTWKTCHSIMDTNILIEKLDIILENTQDLNQKFFAIFPKLLINNPNLMRAKASTWKNILIKLKLKLCYLLQQVISDIAHLYVYFGEEFLILTFRISVTYNECINMDIKYGLLLLDSTVCSNTCPYLMYPLRKISITRLLQILAQNRAELCCHKLIDCLLETYKLHETNEDDASDNSSLEIYRAITKHMSPPEDDYNKTKYEDDRVEEINSFSNMDELIKYEEQNVSDLLDLAVTVAPSMLGYDSIKKSKTSGESKINSKAKNKVMDYYRQILWGEVGNFLEHIILWWGALPLAARPPHSSQHLREWIIQFLPTIEIPNFILAALLNLADALGLHVTSTSWDQDFSLALVASKKLSSQNTGHLFSNLLQNLISLSNQCEVTNDWILGAPLEELPLVEQIPILHRLDHSIHMTNLWAINESKRLANKWDVKRFFQITHSDIVNCLKQFDYLKLNDHTASIEKGGLGAHIQVCANMRAKLVSEVVANHVNLKQASKQCIDILAKVCRIVSLANLQMIFPENHYYQRSTYKSTKNASAYVNIYLDEILSPVLLATDDYHITNMILKIMCEAWLDHIYLNKIKFSHCGAVKLLTDFGSITTWLVNCPILTQHIRKKMLKNEVLRRCEGVGKLLLRSPGEQLKMNENVKNTDADSIKSDDTELMPPEMYVPNQEQWLELRAHKRGMFCNSLCCNNNVM